MPSAKSLWHLDSSTSSIQSKPLNIRDGDLILKSLYSMISIGTERLVANGHVPVNLHSRMRVPYMQGDFNFPVQYGYSLVGEYDGKNYHVLHPHQDIIAVKEQEITEIPNEIPARRASLMSNLETACNAWWDGQPLQHENILIVGFGLIGALIAIWLRLKGFDKIFISEPNPKRTLKATSLGFTVMAGDDPLPPFQLAYHTSSNQDGLQFCIDHMGLEGRIIELSWYGNRPVSIILGEHFHASRLSLKSSQVSTIPAYLNDIHNFRSRKSEVIQMLNYDIWDTLLDEETDLESSVTWFGKIRAGQLNNLSLIIKY